MRPWNDDRALLLENQNMGAVTSIREAKVLATCGAGLVVFMRMRECTSAIRMAGRRTIVEFAATGAALAAPVNADRAFPADAEIQGRRPP